VPWTHETLCCSETVDICDEERCDGVVERPVDDSQMTDENVEPDLWMTADGLPGDAAVLNQVVVDAVNKIHLQDMGCQMSHVHAGLQALRPVLHLLWRRVP